MSRRARLGLDRGLALPWLDAAATQVASGATPAETRRHLWQLLEGAVKGEKLNSARGKTLTVLAHVWSEVPPGAVALRNRAASVFPDTNADERLALHWALLVGTYPLFADTATVIGRLLTLQGSFSQAQLTRRLVESWGERSTLLRAIQRLVRSMVTWGVLADTSERGIYTRASVLRPLRPEVAVLLAEALLVDAAETVLPATQLVSHSALFPFQLELGAGELRNWPRFRVHRQGLDEDFVEYVRTAPAPERSTTSHR